MASNAVLELILKLKDEASGELKRVEGSLGGVNKAALAIGAGAAVAVGALAKGLWDCAQAAAAEEVGMMQLKTAVDASGVSWNTVGDSVEAYIASAQKRTAFDDSVQRQSLTNLITTTGSYEQALSLLPLAMDIARAKGMDLAAASDLVGRVAMGNTGILSRYGIVLEEGATAQEALAMMQERFAGQADAYGKTNAAAAELMSQQWDNLKETIGTYVIPILTTLFQWLASLAEAAIPMVEQAVTELQPIFEVVWGAVQTAIQIAWGIIEPVFAGLVAWFSGPGTAQPSQWGEAISGIMATVQQIVSTVLSAMQGFWQAHGDTVMSLVTTAWSLIQNTINTALAMIQAAVNVFLAVLSGDWEGAWNGVKDFMTAWWTGLQTMVNIGVDGIRLAFGNTWNTIHERTVSAWNAIKNDITSPIRDALGVIQGIVSNIIAAWQRLGSFHIPLPHFRAGTRDVSVAGISFPIPDIGIDWYGKGMPTTVFDKPTMIGVGERGPEAVSVTPLRGGAAGATGGAGGGVTITGNTFIVRSDQDIERIARAIYQQMMAQTGQRIALGQGVYVP